MEKESFVDAEVAERLNSDFISVKVDKEERPDIDAVYMAVCQALTGSGGWPTTILMTHGQKPFFAGTYLPKRSRYGHIGLLELLSAAKKKWDVERASLIESGDLISRALSESMSAKRTGSRIPGKKVLEKAASGLANGYDSQYGGFGVAPKFPVPHNLMFLLSCHRLGISGVALGMVEKTLTQMYRGGIFDHIGGGFSRYSTDKKWLVPHFEKMLYDNALLSMAFLGCFEVTNNTLYKAVAERIFVYLDREMTSEEGGFYSAQDADSDGEEGKYYTFSPKELHDALGKDDAEYFCLRYDVTESGNFEGKSIPNLVAGGAPLLPDDRLRDILERLYFYRQERFELHKDDKLLTSWNALAIAALAKARRVLGGEEYLDRAALAINFIIESMSRKDGGTLFISYRNGKAKGTGILDDYAFLAWACLEMYEASFELCYLEKAIWLAEYILANFSSETGGFYLNANNGEQLLFRTKEQYDGAMPSGNSAAAYVLVRLAALTAENYWITAADKQLAFYADMFESSPMSCTFALLALIEKIYPSRELICVLADGDDKAETLSRLAAMPLRQTSVLIKTPGEAERLAKIAPFTAGYAVPAAESRAFYLCSGGACSAPVYSFEELEKKLHESF